VQEPRFNCIPLDGRMAAAIAITMALHINDPH